MKRISYCSWQIDGPKRSIIVRRNGRKYQVFLESGMIVAGFFGNTEHARKRDAVGYAELLAGIVTAEALAAYGQRA